MYERSRDTNGVEMCCDDGEAGASVFFDLEEERLSTKTHENRPEAERFLNDDEGNLYL